MSEKDKANQSQKMMEAHKVKQSIKKRKYITSFFPPIKHNTQTGHIVVILQTRFLGSPLHQGTFERRTEEAKAQP